MKLLDNALGRNQFQYLSNGILSQGMSWHYSRNTALEGSTESYLDYSFTNVVFDCNNTYQQTESPLFTGCYLALLVCLDRLGFELDELYRIRIGLITNKNTPYTHSMHLDDAERVGYDVGILYITTNHECPTIVSSSSGLINIEHRENRFVHFGGDLPHCSSSPTLEPARININYNYKLK